VAALIIPDEVIFEPRALLKFIHTHGVTRLMTTPSLLTNILDAPDLDVKSALAGLKYWYLEGEVVPATVCERFTQRLGLRERAADAASAAAALSADDSGAGSGGGVGVGGGGGVSKLEFLMQSVDAEGIDRPASPSPGGRMERESPELGGGGGGGSSALQGHPSLANLHSARQRQQSIERKLGGGGGSSELIGGCGDGGGGGGGHGEDSPDSKFEEALADDDKQALFPQLLNVYSTWESLDVSYAELTPWPSACGSLPGSKVSPTAACACSTAASAC